MIQPGTSENPLPFLWSNHSKLPPWMQEYMDWHTNSLLDLSKHQNYEDYKYLILRCYNIDPTCGGLSDRVKPLPLLLLAAHQSHRLLFIDWERPYPLPTFLIPPSRGFEWRVPPALQPRLRPAANNSGGNIPRPQQQDDRFTMTRAGSLLADCQDFSDLPYLFVRLQDTFGGSIQYEEVVGEGSFARVFHDLFHILFEPTPPLYQLIQTTLDQANLQPGRFAVAHYRAEYGKEVTRHPFLTSTSYLTRVTLNALRCATQLFPQQPIFFASDNAVALEVARKQGSRLPFPIRTFVRKEAAPIHLDRTVVKQDNTTSTTTSTTVQHYPPSAYYSTFVDLWVAGSGQCVAYGRGGFGRLASLLSYNASCSRRHVKTFRLDYCEGVAPLLESNMMKIANSSDL
eukprot:Nitzschia sp. Nitz4//scaffold49_size126201//88637//89833//NITZ4_003652-RA/size126201-processed-gene-0.147-mRNA-1//1//CDS//3329553179//634//frame0